MDDFNRLVAIHEMLDPPGTSLKSIEELIAEQREALEKIEARANPRRELEGTDAIVALDSIHRWARKGLGRSRQRR